MFKSLLIYFLTYGLSILLMAFYEKNYREKSLILSVGYRKIHIRNYKKIFWCILIISPVVILSTIRYSVGIDWEAYGRIFKNIVDNMDQVWSMTYPERGYILLCALSSFISHDTWAIFMTTTVLYLVVFFICSNQYRKQISMVYMLFLFYALYINLFYNVLRQMIACAIILCAFKFLFDRKYVQYILLICCAMLFHTSAVFALVFIFVFWAEEKIRLFSIFLPVICIFSPVWMKAGMAVLQKIAVQFFPRYANYINYGTDLDITFYLYIVPPILMLYFWGYKQLTCSAIKRTYLSLMWIQLPLQALGLYNVVAERISIYAGIGQVIIVPWILQGIEKKKNRRIAYVMFTVWYILRFIVMDIVMNGTGTAIYQTIFNNYIK